MTRPGACDNYSRAHLAPSCRERERDSERKIENHANARINEPCGAYRDKRRWILRSRFAGISRRRRHNVWHSLSQYVTHHPASTERAFVPPIGLLQVSSWAMFLSIWATYNQAITSESRTLCPRIAPLNCQVRNHAALNNATASADWLNGSALSRRR